MGKVNPFWGRGWTIKMTSQKKLPWLRACIFSSFCTKKASVSLFIRLLCFFLFYFIEKADPCGWGGGGPTAHPGYDLNHRLQFDAPHQGGDSSVYGRRVNLVMWRYSTEEW